MPDAPKEQTPPITEQRVFELAVEGANASIVTTTQEIDRQAEAIRQLDEITRQIAVPYVGGYYSA
jgi:hypothetical protein